MGWVKWANADNGSPELERQLVPTLGTKMLLNAMAAYELEELAKEWNASGYGSTFGISEAFRNVAKQQQYWDARVAYINYLNGHGPWAPVAYTAAVVHTSTHGEGLAADFNSWIYGSRAGFAHDRLVEMALRHNWSWEKVGKPSGELWHFNYIGNPLATPPVKPLPPAGEDGENGMAFSTEAQQQIDLLKSIGEGIASDVQQLIELPATRAGFAAQVDGQYLDVFGPTRHADHAGLEFFVGLMVGGWKIEQVRSALIASPEYARMLIGVLYQQYLGRTAGESEITGWLSWAQANGNSKLEAAISGSPEAQARK
jgi:hypothetical protein